MQANTTIVTAADGTTFAFSTQMLVERGAVLVTQVNGEAIGSVMEGANQLWIPGLPAKYYVRDVQNIRFEERPEPPRLDTSEFVDDGEQYTNRPNVSMGHRYACQAGCEVTFGGTAGDFDRCIVAIELSMDDGAHWSRYELPGTTAERLVTWQLAYTPEQAGTYRVKARAINDLGQASPIPAVATLEVV